MTLEEFISRIDGFLEKTPSAQILYFCYFIQAIEGLSSFSAKNILACYERLHLPPYSNVSSFLSREAKSKEKHLVKIKSGGYVLSRKKEDSIASQVSKSVVLIPSSSLFPSQLFANTRSYLESTAREALLCYDTQLYGACLVMIRRLIETLIIEIFEFYKVQDRIRDRNGNYKYCGELIDALLSEKQLWTVGRNAAKELPGIKNLGDMSAHNRRFNATQSDIDKIKSGLRIVLEELIHICQFDCRERRN